MAAGTPFPAVIELSDLDGSDGFRLQGIDKNDYAGAGVAGAGDVNGDGLDDLVIGAHGADVGFRSRAGEAYVVFGAANLGSTGSINLAALNGTDGFVMQGLDQLDATGAAVAAGDIDADGFSDLIVGAPGGTVNGFLVGKVYVIRGKQGLGGSGSVDLSALDGNTGFVLEGIDVSDLCGGSVAAGDVNGDGIDDLVIGAYGGDPNGQIDAGEAYVMFGKTTPFPAVSSLGRLYPAAGGNGEEGFVLIGIAADDQAGRGLSARNDVNGDGFVDLAIGTEVASPGGVFRAGQAYVVFGGPGIAAHGLVPLSSLDGTRGFAMNGSEPYDFAGRHTGIPTVLTSTEMASATLSWARITSRRRMGNRTRAWSTSCSGARASAARGRLYFPR